MNQRLFFHPFSFKIFFLLFIHAAHFQCMDAAETEQKENRPHPIQFAIPESKIIKEIPEKDLDFSPLIPGRLDTYIYFEEAPYYKDYQRSYYAITCKKGGWDCMRHYEILANGCIPYFLDLDRCDSNTMYFLPRELIKEAMNLEGVSYLNIDHSKFDRSKYFEILNKLLAYTRKYLTTRAMANYLLNTIHYEETGKILYLSYDLWPDYMRCLLLTGLKEIFTDKVVDYPKVEHIYKNYSGNIQGLAGKGMTYTKNIEDLPIDRTNIEERIRNKEFDLIIYGSVHRGLLFHDLVKETYAPENIVYICGEDYHRCAFIHLQNFFLREFEAL